MKLVEKTDEMHSLASHLRAKGMRIGLVPTMGALHDGHISLIKRASELTDAVVVSIYINPTQFAPEEDLASYPRTLERDIEICRELGVHSVFTPSDQAMYRSDHSTYVEETGISGILCGKSRTSHFRGVTTVVLKLFNITAPHVALFGRKDAQQARVIMRMVRDLNLPVSIELVPTVREPDGLAMSSRNAYLSADERKSAARIYESLVMAQELIESGTRSSDEVRNSISHLLAKADPPIELEYAEIVSDPDMMTLDRTSGDLIIAIAAKIGKTRLIDNIEMAVAD